MISIVILGNDFLPHLPSLDIRDGALDFLIDVYKQSIPSLGDYITYPSGNINLRHVDIILAKVAEIEEMVFQKRKESEDMQERKRQYHSNKNPTQTQATAIQTEFAALQSQIAANSADTNKANANAAANLKAQLAKKRNSSDISEETNKKEKNLETKVITEAEFSSELKKRLKDKENSIFDTYKQSITDNIKLHETGWKDRLV